MALGPWVVPLLVAMLPSASALSASVRPIKNSIVKLAAGTRNGVDADDGTRAQVCALAHLLAEQNPTSDLARSDGIDGEWSLVFTTTGGGSAGKLGPFVGDVEQHFDLREGKYINYVSVGPRALPFVKGALTADWDVLDDNNWQVNFRTISFSLLGVPVVRDRPLNQRGFWRLTYLDDDFRVLYARGGNKPENIYVLRRVGVEAW